MDDVSTITGVIDPDILNSVSDGLLQQLWEGGLLPECVSGAKALRELNKWLGHHETIGRVAHDGGANLVRRINACRAQLVLLERHAASNTQSTTHRVRPHLPWTCGYTLCVLHGRCPILTKVNKCAAPEACSPTASTLPSLGGTARCICAATCRASCHDWPAATLTSLLGC